MVERCFLFQSFFKGRLQLKFWKEWFNAGLLKLFANKVRERIFRNYNNVSDYTHINFGQIANGINLEGLVKISKRKGEKELRGFCY